MKTTTLIFSLFLSVTIYSQDYYYSDVVNVDSTSKDQLYTRAENWFMDTFKDMNEVIENRNREEGIINGHGMFFIEPVRKLNGKERYAIKFDITVWIKDGRYKYEIKNLFHTDISVYHNMEGGYLTNEKPDCGSMFLPKNDWEIIKTRANEEITHMVESIELAMKNPTEVQSDNW